MTAYGQWRHRRHRPSLRAAPRRTSPQCTGQRKPLRRRDNCIKTLGATLQLRVESTLIVSSSADEEERGGRTDSRGGARRCRIWT